MTRIEDLLDDQTTVESVARMLVEGFREHWPHAWPDLDTAISEVRESLAPDRISMIAVEDGVPVGWIGGVPHYGGAVWEVHSLVVRADRRRCGIGRALVAELERRAGARGGLTLWVGTDDEDEMTSLGGIDLYPDPLAHLAAIRDRKGHPFGFYLRLGFSLAGVVPDANGPGRPDILLAKRIAR